MKSNKYSPIVDASIHVVESSTSIDDLQYRKPLHVDCHGTKLTHDKCLPEKNRPDQFHKSSNQVFPNSEQRPFRAHQIVDFHLAKSDSERR